MSDLNLPRPDLPPKYRHQVDVLTQVLEGLDKLQPDRSHEVLVSIPIKSNDLVAALKAAMKILELELTEALVFPAICAGVECGYLEQIAGEGEGNSRLGMTRKGADLIKIRNDLLKTREAQKAGISW